MLDFQRGLRSNYTSRENLGSEELWSMRKLLVQAQLYIKYEKNYQPKRPRRITKIKNRCEDTNKERNNIPYSYFSQYIPLNMSKECMLPECTNVEFKEVEVKYP